MVNISFLGDISFNDEYNELYIKGTKPFSKVSKVLKESDFVVGNLECLASGNKGENLSKKPRLKTSVETLNYLKEIGVDLVMLAHNHIYDNLLDGFLKTTNFLQENEIFRIGVGLSKDEAERPFVKEINKIKFCFLDYVTEDTHPSLPKDAEIFLNWFNENKIINDIRKYRKDVDFMILLLHWGGKVEGGYYPEIEQPEIAKKFIDSGADLIIGHHSHTLQPYEIYKRKYIFYSLENFCFADIYSDGKIKKIDQKGTESIILNINFDKNLYSPQIIPIRNVNLFIEPDEKVLKRYKKRLFYFKFIKRIRIIWRLYYLKFKYIDPVFFYFQGDKRDFIKKLRLLDRNKIIRFIRR